MPAFRHLAALILLLMLVLPRAAAAGSESRAAEIDRLLAEGDRLASQQVRRADLAVPVYRKAIALADRAGDEPRAARGLVGLASALVRTNRIGEAGSVLERALAVARESGEASAEAEATRMLGILAIEQGRYEEASRSFRRAVEIASQSDDAPGQMMALNALSVSARRQGRLAEAASHMDDARRLLDQAVAAGREVPINLLFQVPFNTGKALADGGDYSSAIIHFDKAFEVAERHGTKGGQWHALHDTAEWYLAQGDVERAARYHKRALALSRTLDSRDMEAQSLRGSGSAAEAQGDLSQAADYYRAALALMDRIQMRWDTSATLAALARVRFQAGDRPAAERAVREALARAVPSGQPISLARAHLELARQQLESGRHEEAEREFERGLRIAREQGIGPLMPVALAGLGRVAYARGDLAAAAGLYRQSLDAIAAIRGRIGSIDLRAAFAEAVHATYSSLLETLLELGRRHPDRGYTREALLIVEHERTQNLIQALNDSGVDRSRELPRESRERQRQLHAVVSQLQTRLSSAEIAPAQRGEVLARLDDAERALDGVEGRDRMGPPAGYAGRRAEAPRPPGGAHADQWRPPSDVAALQGSIAGDEAVVAYARAGDRFAAFVITRAMLDLVPLPAIDALDDRIEFFGRILRSARPSDAVPAGTAIARWLLDPILRRLPSSTRRLLFSVTGSLAAVPFAALPIESRTDPGGARLPLLEEYEIAYVPSLAALHHSRTRPRVAAPRDLMAVGDPAPPGRQAELLIATTRSAALGALPHSAREVRALARNTAGGADLLVGDDASEAAFKRRTAGDFRVLHFATHALADPAVPSRSAIVLTSSGGAEDGLLQPREIYGLRLRADLVVLSACRSAAGRASNAEGMQSLARAFLYAGARAVVGTQWDVEDRASASLVERFYDALARGLPAAPALRQAQLALAGPRPYDTAADWAGFILAGDPLANPELRRPLLARLEGRGSIAAGASVALLGMLAWIVARRRPWRTPRAARLADRPR